jgi:hypothetical protein
MRAHPPRQNCTIFGQQEPGLHPLWYPHQFGLIDSSQLCEVHS